MITTPPPQTCSLTSGQIVPWPAAPLGWAQVIELRRRKVRLLYQCKSGRHRFPLVGVAEVQRLQQQANPLLPLFNPMNRALMGRCKSFPIARPH